MDSRRFDALTRFLGNGASRGTLLRAFSAASRARSFSLGLGKREDVTQWGATPHQVGGTAVRIGTCGYHDGDRTGLAVGRPNAAATTCVVQNPPPALDPPVPPAQIQVQKLAARQLVLPLSRREREVVALVAQGLKNREIATKLVLSERTVHAHIRNILDKLGLATRAQIAVWGIQNGLPQRAEPGAYPATAPQVSRPGALGASGREPKIGTAGEGS